MVVFAPYESFPLAGASVPMPLVRLNATGIPEGTKIPPLTVSIPAEFLVRFTRIRELWPLAGEEGVAVTLSTSHGLEVTSPLTRDDGLLFEPHQLLVAMMEFPDAYGPEEIAGPEFSISRQNWIVAELG